MSRAAGFEVLKDHSEAETFSLPTACGSGFSPKLLLHDAHLTAAIISVIFPIMMIMDLV